VDSVSHRAGVPPQYGIHLMKPIENTDDYLRQLLAAKLGTAPATIMPSASLRQDLGVDSLSFVSLVMEIEDELDLDIPDEDAAQLLTVKQLMDYVAFAVAANEMRRTRQIARPYKKAVGHN
jgi:acyl carrier protein